MCCHGNSVSVSYYVQWWCTFPTQKHEKWRSIIFPCEQSQRWDVEQTIFFSGTSQTIVRCCLHIALLGAAWILLSHSDAVLWLWTSCSRYVSTHLLNPLWAAREADWDASVEIRFESQYKPPPSVVWISFEKISFHMFFCCPVFQKADFGWQSEHCVHVKTGIVLFVHWSNVVLHMWAYIHDNYIASKEPKACAVTAFSLGRNRMGSNCSSIKHNSYSQYWVTAVIVGFNCNPGSVKYSKNRNHSVSILDWHFMIQ